MTKRMAAHAFRNPGKTNLYPEEREREATVRDIGAGKQDCRTGNNTDSAKYL